MVCATTTTTTATAAAAAATTTTGMCWYTISDNVMARIDKIKDLGVTFDSRLKFDEHIDIKISKAYQMLGIKRNFIYLTRDSFI